MKNLSGLVYYSLIGITIILAVFLSNGSAYTLETAFGDNSSNGISTNSSILSVGNSTGTLAANAGIDQTVNKGITVYLDGSGSTGKNLTYSWKQISGEPVILDSANTANATFLAPQCDIGQKVLEFVLTVSNGGGESNDSVKVTISCNIENPTETDTIDTDGNYHAQYSNYHDYETHNDTSVEQVMEFRTVRGLQLNETIQNMGDTDFNNGDVATQKKILSDKISDVIGLVKDSGFYGINNDLKEIRNYVTANMTAQGQSKVTPQLDRMISANDLAGQPAPAIQKDPTTYGIPQWLQGILIAIVFIAGGAGIGAGFAVGNKKYVSKGSM